MRIEHRKKRISVVCDLGGFNTGTCTEHLGFHAISRRHGYTDVEYFHLLSIEEYCSYFKKHSSKEVPREHVQDFPIKYSRLLDHLNDLCSSDAIVYWSGWLHMPISYDDYKKWLLAMSLARDHREAMDLVNHHIFLTNQSDEVLNRTIAFGQTIAFNTLRHEVAPGYGDAYQSFYKRIRSANMRDIVSARKISRLRSDYGISHAGVDCATFLNETDINDLPRVTCEDDLAFCCGQVGVFFGRSNIENSHILALVKVLCDELKCGPFSLPWGPSFTFPQLKSLPYQTPASANKPPFQIGDCLRTVRNASAIVTDAYHVCVNAWAMGIPAVCIGSILSTSEFDANSGYQFSSMDKRYIFYAMIDALDFFVHGEELKNWEFVKAHLISIASRIKNRSQVQQIVSGIRKDAAVAEMLLVNELDAILGRQSSSADSPSRIGARQS